MADPTDPGFSNIVLDDSPADRGLENSWNTWSKVVLTIGLGAFGVLVTSPSNDPPLSLLVVGFRGSNGALISLAAAVA